MLLVGSSSHLTRAPVLPGRARIETEAALELGACIMERPSYLDGRGLKRTTQAPDHETCRRAPVLPGRARIETDTQPEYHRQRGRAPVLPGRARIETDLPDHREWVQGRAPVLPGRARIETTTDYATWNVFNERPSYLDGRGLKPGLPNPKRLNRMSARPTWTGED